ncbi:hypothetical protein SLS64_011285 [Diaporthe eres]
MGTSDLPPKALVELMKDDHEIEIFEDFKVASAKKLHAGFTHKAVYDDQRAVYAPLPSTDLIADLEYKPQGCGWEDVLNCIAIAKASYDDKAWQTRIKNKEEILRQLEDLPVLLSTATEKWKFYSRDENLKSAVRNLYETVADSLSILIRILLRKQEGSWIGSYKALDAPRPTKTDKILISKVELLLYLNLGEVGSIVEDVDRIRQQGTNVASEGRELARKIMNMAQFTEWVQEDHSRLLLVDGHCKDLGNGKTSPLSVLCASLASNFAESDSLVILQYYCGHHGLDFNGLPAGPLGLIRSLVAQLLRKSDDVLPQELEIDRELYDRVNPNDIDNLCEIFGVIFSQINRNKITLCIIDEIAEFEGERGGWADGMSLVAFQLRWMVHQFQGPQRLKVLMSSADKSAVVSQLLDDDDKISFRDRVKNDIKHVVIVMEEL